MTVMLQAENLGALPGLRHGFFTRKGGVSNGIYKSLNCGLGSKDERARVMQNRAFIAGMMGVAANRLTTLYQSHTTKCIMVDQPHNGVPPEADALVTKTRGLALAVSTADCTPILLADMTAGVIGAVHAGWRGAVAGILLATINRMKEFGATPQNIAAAIGPVIRQESYEVGLDVYDQCIGRDQDSRRFFKTTEKTGHFQFDLPGLVAAELQRAGILNIEDLKRDTYREEELFFSYRRMTHRGEADYGRHLHAICLEE